MSSKRKRRKPEQIIRCLAEGESILAAGRSAADVYQKVGIAESTWMRWKQQYGGMKSAFLKFHTPVNHLAHLADLYRSLNGLPPAKKVGFPFPSERAT